MFAFVIPYRKTPRDLDGFSYHIPLELAEKIKVGSIVHIPFRSKVIEGLVWSIHTEDGLPSSTKKKVVPKDIIDVLDLALWYSPQRRIFLEWFAKIYHVSLATAWKTMQPAFPKRSTLFQRLQESANHILLSADIPSTPIKASQPIVHIWNSREQQYTTYRNSILENPRSVHIIITAEDVRAQTLTHQLLTHGIQAHHFESTPTLTAWDKVFSILSETTEEPRVIIGSKRLLFLPLPSNTHIIIDDEAEKSHKQYDSNPRYTSRLVALQLHTLFHFPLLFSDMAPSMATYQLLSKQEATLLDSRDNWDSERVHIANMHGESSKELPGWLSETAITELSQAKRSFVFLNRLGKNAALECIDCATSLPLHAPLCPSCGSTRLKQTQRGIDQLYLQIQKLFPHTVCIRIDSTTAPIDTSTLPADKPWMIIGTEQLEHTVDIQSLGLDLAVVLSVDHLLLYPHYGARERVFQLLTGITLAARRTIIQTYASQNDIFSYVAHNDIDRFWESEWKVRVALKLPPVQPYWVARPPHAQNTADLLLHPKKLSSELLIHDLSSAFTIERIDG